MRIVGDGKSMIAFRDTRYADGYTPISIYSHRIGAIGIRAGHTGNRKGRPHPGDRGLKGLEGDLDIVRGYCRGGLLLAAAGEGR